jgi:hypothetical protein
VDVDAIGLKVRQEFAGMDKAKLTKKSATKALPQKARKSA